MANHLKNEKSPYLQQHVNNPVNWYSWGEKAFEKARREKKAIFLSIGYSSCHWCHIMRHESFEDEHSATILNKYFISIKVDREERPDIDKYFQDIYRVMNGSVGGWPTSIFLSEDLKPFYSATYIPNEPKYSMMSFSSLLEVIADKYKHQKNLLITEANRVLDNLYPEKNKIQATKLDNSIINRYIEQTKQLFDNQNGGFTTSPKFPQTSTIDLLIDLYYITRDKQILEMITLSLDSMAKGGLRDLIDGGFSRYCTDEKWNIPHFEKMTYDNALLSSLYLKAYFIDNNNLYKNIAFETLDFMLGKMSEEKLFYSASDADMDDTDGKYYLYTYDKVLKSFEKAGIPHENHKSLLKALHISKKGNFKGKNIIYIDNPASIDIPYYDEAIIALQKRREKREYPFIDKKVIVSWNAMMITALFQAGRIDSNYLKIAKKSLHRLLESMYINSKLYHSTLINEKPKIEAFLEDYAYLSESLIEAYKSTLDSEYLITAQKLVNTSLEKYYNNGKWKFSTGEFETDANINDSSYASSVATILSSLYSINTLIDPVYKKFVFKTLERYSYDIMRQPVSTPKMSKIIVRYLKDDIIIKAKEEKLKANIDNIDKLPYPFLFMQIDTNNEYSIYNSNNCLGHKKEFKNIIDLLKN